MRQIEIPKIFSQLKNPPKEMYAMGNLSLLDKKKIAIVGSRRASFYSKQTSEKLSSILSSRGIAVVSGAAMGIDTSAHLGAFPNTIAILANSLDIFYPKINEKLINDISKKGLLLSEYPSTTYATKYSFVLRNRLVVALSEALVIAQADIKSGSLRSAEFAIELGIPIYVLPHRIGESEGTARLVKKGMAKYIYDLNEFANMFAPITETNLAQSDEVLDFIAKNNDLSSCIQKFGDKIYEYELMGKIVISQMKVKIV